MILAVAAAALSVAQVDLLPPCRSGAAECGPWERAWRGDDWLIIGTVETGSVWSIHPSSVIVRPEVARVWVKIDHSRDNSERANRSQGLLVLWCDSRQFHWESLTAFAANGAAMPLRWPRRTTGDNIAPESVIESIWQWACGPWAATAQ